MFEAGLEERECMSRSNTWGKNAQGEGVKHKGAEARHARRRQKERPPRPWSPFCHGSWGQRQALHSLAHHSTLSPGRASLPSAPLVNLHPTITILCPGLFPADL